MFRTRDFILLFTVICFLAMAIGVTALTQFSEPVVTNELKPANTTTDFTAEVATSESQSREERLREMRQKIAASGDVIITAPSEPVDEIEEEAEEIVSEDTEPAIVCTNQPINREYVWPVKPITFELIGANRIISYEETSTVQSTTSSSSIETKERVVLASLPVPFGINATPRCIEEPVVAITIGGALIRNADVSMYSLFGSDTLIGYALDGFPVYGVSGVAFDTCGGRMVNGQYRYEVSKDRATILNCFSGIPIRL